MNKCEIFKNFAPFSNCKSEINNPKDFDIIMPMCNLIEYLIIIQKHLCLWQYYKDEPYDNLADSESFKSKVKITGNTPADGITKDVEIIVPLKYLSKFWRTFEMPIE